MIPDERHNSLHPLNQQFFSVNVDAHHNLSKPLHQASQDAFDQGSVMCLDSQITVLGRWAVAAGGHADVWQGYLGKRIVAIKVTRPFSGLGQRIQRDKLLRQLCREYLTWSSLSHPNILECLGFSHDFAPESYPLPSLISPWMSNGTVLSYLENHPDADRLALLSGIADGLSYLHTRKPAIVHGDVRGSNILVSDSGVPCFSDFGLSRVLSEVKGMTTSSGPGGSLRWMSPELLHNDSRASMKSDTWAYGMTMLEILSGNHPYFEVKSDVFVFGRIKDGEIPSRPEEPYVSDSFWSICRNTWSLEPFRRPSMPDLASGLHAFRNNSYKLEESPYQLDTIHSTTPRRSSGVRSQDFRIVNLTSALLNELTQF